MKKIIALLLAAVMLCTGCASQEQIERLNMLSAAPSNPADSIPDICQSPNGKYTLGLCISSSHIKDGGFNEFCLNGMKTYATEHDMTYKYYAPSDDATDNDFFDCIRAAAMNGAEVIIVVGFNYGTALSEAAPEYPDIKFIFIDGWELGFDNILSIAFKEHEGGYLAGYSAVKDGYTQLGFVGGGGGSSDVCNRYGRGFVCGAEDAAKELGVKVSINYTYQYATTYSGSPELQAMANAWYTNGTEVIFSAAGAAQDCIAAAAGANDAWIIACDADASGRSKAVLTSSLKRTDIATEKALEICYSDLWEQAKGKSAVLGIVDDAIGLPTDTWRFENFTIEEYEVLIDELSTGKIEIDDDHRNNKSSEWIDYRYM